MDCKTASGVDRKDMGSMVRGGGVSYPSRGCCVMASPHLVSGKLAEWETSTALSGTSLRHV